MSTFLLPIPTNCESSSPTITMAKQVGVACTNDGERPFVSGSKYHLSALIIYGQFSIHEMLDISENALLQASSVATLF